MRPLDRDWFILLFLALGLLAVSIVAGDEIFPNAAITLVLRIIGVLIIIGIIAFWAWKVRK